MMRILLQCDRGNRNTQNPKPSTYVLKKNKRWVETRTLNPKPLNPKVPSKKKIPGPAAPASPGPKALKP